MQFSTRQRGLVPPPLYGLVEEDVHRSGQPTVPNFAFLEQLKLRTVCYLSPDASDNVFRDFLRDEKIEFIHLGAEKETTPWAPISEETVLEALSLILDVEKHPLLVVDHLGMHRTGVVFGCLRKAQGWALTSIVEEYRRYAGSKARLQNEQFVELFDVDLVRVPATPPPWFRVRSDT